MREVYMQQNIIQRILRHLVQHLGVAPEYLAVQGIIRFRRIPDDWSEAEYRRLWLPEWNSDGTKIIRESIITPKEKDRYTVEEYHNILTTSGRQEILTYLASTAANTPAFAQEFGLGNFPINKVEPGDTQVQGELFRAAPSTATITGTQLDLAVLVGAAQAVGTLTNAGLFGVNATGTANSGTMMTHALIANFVKANGPTYTVDYLLNIQ
ncbi:MAG TPA: hypothetical protein VHV10_02295 [Ktedonobacteraceae bacterium]|nr:hypothetical protein [Ktedonobacteraceae bacterium]